MNVQKESKFGAGDRDRTGDIQLGKLTLPLVSFPGLVVNQELVL